MWTDLLDGRAFASFGSGNPGIGTFDFLTLTVEGVGDLSAFGLVAQGGQLNSGLSASITVPEPATLVMAAGCLMAFAGCRRHV